MAVGNILGFSADASGHWHRWFPFLTSRACCSACGNLKVAFLVAVVFLILCTLVTLHFAKEVPRTVNQQNCSLDSAPLLDEPQSNGLALSKSKPDIPVATSASGNIAEIGHEQDVNQSHVNPKIEDQNENFNDGPGAVLVNLLTSLRHLPAAMHSVLIVMALSWDRGMGRMIGTGHESRGLYHLNQTPASIACTVTESPSLLHNRLGHPSLLKLQKIVSGSRLVWAMSNFIVFACMANTAIISSVSIREYSQGVQHVFGGNGGSIKIASLVLFALLGFSLAITYSVPFSITTQLTADSSGGQGLAIGVLNLAIVIPQMIVSLGAGPWDALYGGGNIRAFVLASLYAAPGAGVVASLKLPDLARSSFMSSGFHFG